MFLLPAPFNVTALHHGFWCNNKLKMGDNVDVAELLGECLRRALTHLYPPYNPFMPTVPYSGRITGLVSLF